MAEETTQETTHQEETHTHADGTVHHGAHHHEEPKEGGEEEDKFPKSTSTIEEAGAARKRIKVEIPEERVQGRLKESLDELQKEAVLPGFRKGRAPRRLLEKRFSSEVRDTLKGQLVAEAYQKAIEDHKLEAIGEPEVDMKKVELPASGPLTVSLEVEITPEFGLPNIEKVAVKRPTLEANDERVNLAVENLRRHFGQWKDATGAATKDDAVLMDVKVQDPENNVLTEQQNVQMAVKAGSIAGIKFDELGDKLTGAKPSDVITLQGIVPDGHPQVLLRGKTLTVTLSVKQIRHLDLPEVNEEFVKMLGFENVEELRKDLRERLVVQLEQETKNAMAQQVYRYLLANTQLDLPPHLSQRQMLNVLRRRATQLMQQGVPENDIVAHIDQLRISSAQQAAVDLKLFFILGKLAKQWDLDVSEGELNAKIAFIAETYGRRPERVRHELSQQGQMEQLYLQVRDGKVVDKILETAEITEVDEKTLAEELKSQPMVGTGLNVTGLSVPQP